MKLTCICNNCKANIIYKDSDIQNTLKYIRADAIKQGHLIVWERNIFKEIKAYYINCPQCKKNTICGEEILKDRVYKEKDDIKVGDNNQIN